MLSKFILVSETRFQNSETALKNQQASIRGLETQIGQLSKLISERPQGSLPSNTKPNLREHLNAISTQDKEGFIASEPEIQQDNAMNKGREEVNNNDPKQMPNSAKFLKELLSNKRKLDATSHVELNAVCLAILRNELPNKLKDPGSFTIPCLIGSDNAVTLQARNSVKTSKTQANAIKPVDDKTNIQSSLQELPRTKTIEIVCYYHEENKDVHEERRLRIEELDKWQEHKPRTHDKLKLRKHKPDTSPNQLQVGDTILLDAVDPHIVTTTPNEEIPLTVLSVFPFGTVEVNHPKFGTFKERRSRSHPQRDVEDRVLPRYVLQPKFRTRSLNFHKLRRRSYFRYYVHDPSPQVVMTNNDEPGTIHFRLGGLALAPFSSTYDPSRSKASAFPPSLRYLHAILAHTLTGRRESTGVVNTHDAYYLWCMANAHVTNLAYFIAFAIRHQTERHRKGVISIGPYVTRLAKHFDLLNTAAQSSTLTLIGQMSPQGITTMLHMRMIER
ncbi:hypothetical protein GOBAR_AA20698 [Gossypium barbadense]|uniref:Uncharacterized protein n=1 Tax=Gossypium barbadense TaxID=3634 RepID=A0A2P5X9F4_GOSBA|nr:hypothetical protein GOBAR_AA20698 [Gossypium barbadense]